MTICTVGLRRVNNLWASRLQEARLKVLMKVIEKRDQENEAANDERVERIWQRKLQEREATFQKINKRRIKGICYMLGTFVVLLILILVI